MSGTGESTAAFAGADREFRIRLGEIRRIQTKCGASIGEVLRRLSRCSLLVGKMGGLEALAAGVDIYADDVREPIYQGLIGAGMPSIDATKLLDLELDQRGVMGLLDNATTALAVLLASQQVPEEDDPPGEPEAGANLTTPPSSSTSPPSTASA